ncbi:TetR/AcrR family transcriptional regulator [Paludifilum halophilum]|uniref:HTH tetR-type domain-containing protein n=1 Tax=Paludifilum halophilum TaxID=1642702 RepID=A0A235B964_9BACL|nr:TetR/AcrR family transcriptional regulator [Paludifilum halophilum]OYD08135.1 hypothetical protein CHM34_08475 [Paludifilum halophilum]
MPRSPKQNREIREQRIRQILDATLSVYRDRGYHGAEMGEIARRAGVGRGLVYYYFKDKQDVFLTLIRYSLDWWKKRMALILRLDAPVSHRLAEYLRTACSMALEHPNMSHFHQSIAPDVPFVFPERKEEVWEIYQETLWDPVRSLLREGVETGEIRVSPAIAERIVFSALQGAVNQECGMLPEEDIDLWVNAVLNGLAYSIPDRT